MSGIFVTGTDTDCGKTTVSVALLNALREQGKSVAPFKPVAAGAEQVNGQWQNDDALRLMRAADCSLPYEAVNPYCFQQPISPHLSREGQAIDMQRLLAQSNALQAEHDLVLVEGAGGWLVPLDEQMDVADLAVQLQLPVLLVVGLRLGCLNHARLTEKAILSSGAPYLGWIGSVVDPNMLALDQNIATLEEKLEGACLGILSNGASEIRFRQGVDISMWCS